MKSIGCWLVFMTMGVAACVKDDDVANPLSDSDTDSGMDSDPLGGTIPIHPFFVVHLEPGNPAVVRGAPNPERAEAYFFDLLDLVDVADVDGHKLTLMFTPQWASFLASPQCTLPGDGQAYHYNDETVTTCLELVDAWFSFGHEPAFHHHPFGTSSWDGFSNGLHNDEPNYLGNMNDFLAQLESVAQVFRVATSEEFPIGGGDVEFTTARGPTPYRDLDDGGDLVSRPCSWHEDRHDVWRMRMRLFTSSEIQDTTLDEVQRAISDHDSGDTIQAMGFVTHAKDVNASGLLGYQELFTTLAGNNLWLKGASEVGERFEYTEKPAERAEADELCGADEGL